jgi:hypothetical protein
MDFDWGTGSVRGHGDGFTTWSDDLLRVVSASRRAMMKEKLTNSPLSRDTLKFSLLCVESANLFQKLGGNLARNALEGNSFPPPPETETVPVSGRDMVVDIGSYGGIGLCYRYGGVVVSSDIDKREKEDNATRCDANTRKGPMCIDRYVVPVGLQQNANVWDLDGSGKP